MVRRAQVGRVADRGPTIDLNDGRSGTQVSVRGVQYDAFDGYGGSTVTWLFDRAALAAAGATIADVTGVVSSAPSTQLTWPELGFDLA